MHHTIIRGALVLTAAAAGAFLHQARAQSQARSELEETRSGSVDSLSRKLKSRPSMNGRESLEGENKGMPWLLTKGAAVAHAVLLLLLAILAVWRGSWDMCILVAALAALVLLGDTEIHKSMRDVAGIPHPVDKQTHAVKEAMSKVDKRIEGSWIKVNELSESMTPAVNMLQLNGIAKKAVGLFKGVDLKLRDNGYLEMGVFSVIPFIKVSTEQYSLTGVVSTYPRRDMRKGVQYGTAGVNKDGSICICLHWDPPLGGEAKDEVKLNGPNELHVTTTLKIGTKACKYTVVYYRDGHK